MRLTSGLGTERNRRVDSAFRLTYLEILVEYAYDHL